MLSTQPGGAETFFEKLALAFAEAGVPQCLVIEPNGGREALFAAYPHVNVVPIAFGGVRECFARRRLKRVFEEFAPDVALTWMNRASRRAPRGHCPVVGRLGGYYNLKHYRACDHLVGITPDLVEHIVGQGRDRSEVTLIPNFGEYPGDDLPDRVTARRELGLVDDDYVVLALGRLHEVKAHDTLIRALARVRRGQGSPPILLIAGEGPLRGELSALCEEMGLSDRVRLLGWRRDISRLMAACDLSVFPSRYEPNGTVVMESWAHGRPLVASRAKGPEWLVDDGVNGLLFPVDDVEALADCIDKVMKDPVLASKLVEGGLKKWKQSFSRRAVVDQYLKLFESLRIRSG